MQLSLIADGVLIAACLTTAIYCLVLSRRLRRLSQTDDGIGQQIIRLNSALEETKSAVAEMKSATRAASENLTRDIDLAKHQGSQLQKQIARAIKAGVSDQSGDRDADTPRRKEVSFSRTEGFSVPEPDVKRSAIPSSGEEDRSNEAPDEPEKIVDFDSAAPVEAASNLDDDETALSEALQEDADISEAPNHWPFDDAAAETEFEHEQSEPSFEYEEEEAVNETTTSETREDNGLLRVERMAV